MKVVDKIKLALYEVKCFWKNILAYILIVACIFGVGVSLLSCAVSIPDNFDATINKTIKNGSNLIVNNVNSDEIDSLKENGGKYVESFFYLENATIKLNSTKMTIPQVRTAINFNNMAKTNSSHSVADKEQISVNSMLFENDLPNWLNVSMLKRGEVWQSSMNQKNSEGNYYAWINENVASEFGIDVGSKILIETSKKSVGFDIKGIIDVAKDCEFGMISIYAQMDLMDTDSINTHIYFDNAQGVMKLIKYMNANSIEYIDFAGFSEYIKTRDMIGVALYCVLAIVSIVGVVVASVLFGIFIQKRKNFIGILKGLGMGSGQIATTYYFILQAIVCISLLISAALSFLINIYILSIAKSFFGNEFIISFSVIGFIAYFLVLSLVVVIDLFWLNRKVSQMHVAKIIKERA